MVTTRAESGEGERDRCRVSMEESLRLFSGELEAVVRSFAGAIKSFRLSQNRVAVAEWYLLPDNLATATRPQTVDDIVARVSRFTSSVERTSQRDLHRVARELSFHAYNVRNAVLAHISVLSTGNLFSVVVPAFERLSERFAVAAWARRAQAPFAEAATRAGIADGA